MEATLQNKPAGEKALPVGEQEAAARRSLRQQIARQEARRAQLVCEAFPEKLQLAAHQSRGARLQSLGELEKIRDRMVAQNQQAETQLHAIRLSQQAAQLQLAQMLENPQAHRGIRISQRDLGEPGCGVYRVAPKLGVVGRLAGWWQVKMSSGCP